MNIVSKAVSSRQSTPEIAFENSLKILTGFMVFAGGIISWLHHFLHTLYDSQTIKSDTTLKHNSTSSSTFEENNVLDHKPNEMSYSSSNVTEEASLKESVMKKKKLSFSDSVKILLKDRYLMNIAMMVLSYGLTIEFTEIIWKSTVRKGNAAYSVVDNYYSYFAHTTTF